MKALHVVAAITLLLISKSGTAQIRTGTIITYMLTDSDFVLAADSRAFIPGGPQWDDACKIHLLNSKVIFVASGFEGDPRKQYRWYAEDLAKTLATPRPLDTADAIDALAQDWLKKVRSSVEQTCRTTAPLKNPDPNPVENSAIFAGLVNGRIHVAMTEFWFDSTKVGGGACTTDANVHAIAADGNEGKIHAFGSGEELVENKIKNPTNMQKLMTRIQPQHGPPPDLSEIVHSTYEYSLVAIEFSGEHGDVGGPIDQVHLGKGGIEWVHRKKNCEQ